MGSVGADTVWERPTRAGSGPGSQTSGGPLAADAVDIPAALLPGSPVPRYPDAQRDAGIPGHLTLEFVIDTAGRAERGSVRVVATDAGIEATEAFARAVREALAASRYQPALYANRRVRQLVRQTLVFALVPR